MRTVIVTGDGLKVQDVIDVARGEATAELGPDVPAAMEFSRVVEAATAGDTPVYGVNTGFGALADTPVGVNDLARLRAPSSARTPRAPGPLWTTNRPGHPPAARQDPGRRVLGCPR